MIKNDIGTGFVYGSQVISGKSSSKGYVLNDGINLPEGDVFYDLAMNDFVVFSSLLIDKNKFFEAEVLKKSLKTPLTMLSY